MYGRSCTCLLAISTVILAAALVRGQSGNVKPAPAFATSSRPGPPPQPPGLPPGTHPGRPIGRAPGSAGFPLIARAAGTIFSGTVTAITPRPATPDQAIETVAITFHVEDAIRGATPGDDLKIEQWIGLWSGGQCYRLGEHVLLFLYPPSHLGLTSSVGGALGRFTIDPSGGVLLSPQHVAAFRSDPVLGGKSRVRLSDFALAVRRAGKEQ